MATRSAIVLGAGMVGVTSALHLQRRSWSVALIDRNEVGLETSYGNAGVIQSEAVRPYSMPRDLRSLAAIATRRTNDVHYSLASLPRHLGPLVRYWWHSAPRRHGRISDIYARIIGRAADEHDDLIRKAGADVLVRRDGYRVLHRRQIMMNEAIAEAESLQASYGIPYRVVAGPSRRPRDASRRKLP
jgi:D-amino-acid dehydrogenase